MNKLPTKKGTNQMNRPKKIRCTRCKWECKDAVAMALHDRLVHRLLGRV